MSRNAICGKCSGYVEWKRTGGRWFCFNPDGSDHWDTCSKRVFAKIKREGRPIVVRDGREIAKGYAHPTLGIKFVSREGIVVTGKRYKPTKCERACKVPPWDECDCTKRAP